MCDKCKKIKAHLESVDVEFDEVGLGDDEGVAELRKIFVKIRDKVTRTEDGQLPIPLIVKFENDKVTGVAHTLDEVKSLL